MNFPAAHLESLRQSLGNELEDFIRAYEKPAPVSIRINRKKWSAQPPPSVLDYARTDRVPWCEYGYYLSERPSFTHDPLFHAGCYYVQEASSMFLSHVAKTVFPKNEPLKVLDLSSAPGGKSTLLLSELNEDSLLVANEVIRSRAHILAENISKWGKANVVITNNDPEDFSGSRSGGGSLKGFFDVIVVDAPCSGEGLFRRDPELTREWSPENVDLCSARQRRIVMDIWSSLKSGGFLVYSTCTFNTRENEENLSWLKSQLSFELIELNVPENWNIVKSSYQLTNQKPETVFGYRFYPHRVRGEGFFISVLRKTDEQESSSHKEKVLFSSAPSKEKNAVADWLNDAKQFQFVRRGDHLLAIPKQHEETIHRLSRTLNCVQYGIPVADAQKGLKPLHELAMSIHLNKDAFHQTELTKEEALKFLAKEDFKVNDAHKGISLMTYEGHPLGWMNLLGNRANNLYPKEWRIRKL